MLGGWRYGVWRYKDGGPTAPARILDHTSSWIALKREVDTSSVRARVHLLGVPLRPAVVLRVLSPRLHLQVGPRPPRGLISSRAWRALELTVASLFE
ncbi:hypothetical protein HBI56_078350 [Parastagonospora nodorum]|nr:hypothetical protein HBH51_022500 [Parastagonospora nodorum]KAH4142177.1 hypothetical protein HBH45_055520 [Parastagonospora nodorum]KAH4156186.1 hypothetical protein HBH44_132260 [Parastagonospora nodorum]KAH4576020.1 hypothetical protein HBH84_076870 [Parastagonospora nodorum]KAH4625031.1 hypothetical protein HBH55_134040 [Parastagonospora nodorum]